MKPIIFSAPMVRAILSGRKSQTRRIVKPQPELCSGCQSCDFKCNHFVYPLPKCPYGNIETKLWIRETWRPAMSDSHQCYAYRADLSYKCGKPMPDDCENILNWRPSIFMPKEAARIFLEVSQVQIQRLHDISEEDALSEGIEPLDDDQNQYIPAIANNNAYIASSAKEAFQELWQSINGSESWKSNPWVWVISFEQIFF